MSSHVMSGQARSGHDKGKSVQVNYRLGQVKSIHVR